jgi:protease-4
MDTPSFDSPGAPPPMALPPPPVITPPPPSKPRKSRGWMIFAIILLVVLLFSLLINFTQFISHALNRNFNPVSTRDAGPRIEEYLLKDNDAHNKIAVVSVNGIITGSVVDQSGNNLVDVIKAQLDRAKDDDRVRAVILKVDSPGGEVMASDEINKAIRNFQNKSGKPVVCSMGSLAASGGYYISAPCRWIVANDLTITASIGVIMETLNYRSLMNKVGVEPVVYKSGKYKDMLSGMRSTNEIPPGEHEMVQKLITDTYDKFKGVVRDGRAKAHDQNKPEGKALVPDWESYADGRVLSGTDALQYGFVDQLGDFDDAVKTTEKIVGIHKANLVEYRETYDISDFLHLFGQSESAAHDIKLDLGMNLPRLEAGQLYFLSPTLVN